MDAARFDILLAWQMTDSERRPRVDFVLCTGDGIEPAQRQVRRIPAVFGKDSAGFAGGPLALAVGMRHPLKFGFPPRRMHGSVPSGNGSGAVGGGNKKSGRWTTKLHSS